MEHTSQQPLGALRTGLLVPVAVVAFAVLLPFILLKPLMIPFQRKRRTSAEKVAELLRSYIAGTATAGERDYFESCELADPELEGIRAEVTQLSHVGDFDAGTNPRFRELLARVETLASSRK
jgi:flagellar biosynthesis/type III secretory pathway M-ring protein FliF/YscJ